MAIRSSELTAIQRRMTTVDKAIRNAAYILSEIDKKWPTKAPASFDL
jgi:hypothetical protein